ncbi:hypothetical protein [Rhizobium sp. NFR03]|uniref:hypothetical protein n=1 Tax=Rhizobium sp. NFR03 TaxID=1566263 RepID=UPI001114845A|nr:hypothetical protein [Rhizobium sp. NFR03]
MPVRSEDRDDEDFVNDRNDGKSEPADGKIEKTTQFPPRHSNALRSSGNSACPLAVGKWKMKAERSISGRKIDVPPENARKPNRDLIYF